MASFCSVLSKPSSEESEEGDPKADFLEGLSPLTAGRTSCSCQAEGVHVAAPRLCPGCLKAWWPGSKRDSQLGKGSLGWRCCDPASGVRSLPLRMWLSGRAFVSSAENCLLVEEITKLLRDSRGAERLCTTTTHHPTTTTPTPTHTHGMSAKVTQEEEGVRLEMVLGKQITTPIST